MWPQRRASSLLRPFGRVPCSFQDKRCIQRRHEPFKEQMMEFHLHTQSYRREAAVA